MAKKSTWRPVYREITSSARQLVNAGWAWRETVKRVVPTEWVATPERMAEAQKLLAEVKGWQTRTMARRPDATQSSKPGDKVKFARVHGHRERLFDGGAPAHPRQARSSPGGDRNPAHGGGQHGG